MQAQRRMAVLCTMLPLIILIVFHVQAAQVQLSWTAPTTNADGTTLTDLAGYMVYYGLISRSYNVSVDVGLTTSAALSGLVDGQTYYFTVTAYDLAGNESAFSGEIAYTIAVVSSDEIPAVNPGGSQNDVIFAVNVGGPQYIASDGTTYQADGSFSGGTTHATSTPIAGTADSSLYQRVRDGDFSYDIPVANGAYAVTLQFAEIYWTAAGRRVFDVLIEGQLVINDLDLVAQVGAFRAYDVVIPVSVSDGVLNIRFRSVDGHALVSAIRVVTGGLQ